MGVGTAVRHRLGRFEPVAAEAYRSWFVDLGDLAATLASLGPAARILELGCGEGALAQRLVTAFPGAAYVGLDPSPHAGRLYDGDSGQVAFRSCTSSELVAEHPEPFDLAVIADVLHHIPSEHRRQVIADAASLVRRGGLVAVKDWEGGRNVATALATFGDRYVTGDRHVRFFALDELRALVADGVGPSELVVEARVPPRRNNVLIVRRIG